MPRFIHCGKAGCFPRIGGFVAGGVYKLLEPLI